MEWIVGLVIIAIIAFIAYKSIKIVNQSEVYIIERLGKYHKTATAGLTVIVPFVDTVRAVISLKKQIMDIPPQAVITADNVTIAIDTVVFYQVTNPEMAVYEIQSLKAGIENLAVSSMRDVIGKMELDETFSSRDSINNRLRLVLDEATDPWGCKIEKVEIKEIKIPEEIRESMEKQMNAERTKRAVQLEAEGQRQASITIAEGKKESAILEAEAKKASKIKIAEGEAEAIKKLAEAEALRVKEVYTAIESSKPSDRLVQLKALETLTEASKGEANKVFIPFDATKALASLGALGEAFESDGKTKKIIGPKKD